MKVSLVSVSLDDDMNPVFEPGTALVSRRVEVEDNSEKTLLDTFEFKAKKILPNVKLHRADDKTLDPRAINIVFKNERTASLFAEFSDGNAMMLFYYRGVWATFHHHSTEQHVRDALNHWKKDLQADAEAKDIKVTLAGAHVVDVPQVKAAMAELPPDTYLMVFGDSDTQAIYDAVGLDMNEWPSLLFGQDGLLRAYDKSIHKHDLHSTEDEQGQCVVCKSSDDGRATCKSCGKNYHCDACRLAVRRSFAQGTNPHCVMCGLHTPVYSKFHRSYILHKNEGDMVLSEQIPRLKHFYGEVQLI